MPLTLQRHADTVNTFQPLEDPTQSWRRWGLIDLVRYGLLVRSPWRSKSALCHGVPQQRQRHHHEYPFNAVGFWDNQRRDKKEWVFEKPKTPCNVSLALGGSDHLGVVSLAGVDIGAQDIAGLGLLGLLNQCVLRMDVALDVPRDGLQWRARCGTALASIAFVFGQMRGRHGMILPAL